MISINLKIVNTQLGVILPYAASSMPLALVLFRNYFLELPPALAEAARLDGCSRWGVYWRIIMPLSRPAIGAVAIFTFVSAWNEFFLALVFLQDKAIQTLPLGMQVFAISGTQANYPAFLGDHDRHGADGHRLPPDAAAVRFRARRRRNG